MREKIFLIGELISDQNLHIENRGKTAEFNAPKNILIKSNINFGGAGMVYTALKLLSKKVEFHTISNFNIVSKLPKDIKKNIIFDENYKLEKNRFWHQNKMIMQLNNIKKSKRVIIKFQKHLMQKIKKIKEKDIVILSDYRHEIFEKSFTKKLIKIIKLKKCKIYVDQQCTSKKPDLMKFKNIDFLLLNKSEYLKAFKVYKIKEINFKNSLRILQKKLGIERLIVKVGKNGSICFDGESLIKVKAFKKNKVLNTVGAGDFFLARFATLKNIETEKKLFFSNKFAYQKISNRLNLKVV